ncbi:MAG: DUF2723 domain-containing protein [Armatimonadetes bacterium]|nr:DUF2723 domain-containing protein [Armatimonadota bacterium]
MPADTLPVSAIGRKDGWVATALGAGFLLLYLRTLCPTVYLGDSGEISTAITTGGVIHPPGYPLFSLLGRAALWLIPSGEPAFRIGCAVAATAAAAVVTLYFLARELDSTPWASAIGAATFGASYAFWSQSTRVEVYSLHVLLAGLALLAGLRYRRSGRLRHLATAVLAGSLGLAHHLTIVLLAPAVLLLCGHRLWKDSRLARRLAVISALLPVGPALYLLLLAWARSEPLIAWGRTVTLPSLWTHASARIYQKALQIPFGERLLSRLMAAWNLFTDNFPYLLFLLPILGAWLLWKRNRPMANGLLLAMVAVTAYNLCYRIGDIASYYLPVWMVAATLLTVALDAAARRAQALWSGLTRIFPYGSAAAVFVLLIGMLLLRNWSACDLAAATWVREFARHKLENADPGSVLITQGDQDMFPIWYVRHVLHIRPDVTPLDRSIINGTWTDYDREPSLWYLRHLRRLGMNVPLDVPADPAQRVLLGQDRFLIRLLTEALRERPLCITFATTSTVPGASKPYFLRWAEERYHMLPLGIILRLHPKSQPVHLAALLRQNERLWSQMALPDTRGVRTDQDLDPRYLANHYACMLVNFGGLREMAGDLAGAEALYLRAAEWAPRYRPATEALASVRRRVAAHPYGSP